MILEKNDISAMIAQYSFQHDYDVQLIKQGLNDTYLLSFKNDIQLILRVYRPMWRNATEINFELELLMHLKRKGFTLSTPIEKKMAP